jgi:hypothetical protein
MQPATRPEELGQVVSHHAVDRRRRFTVTVIATSLGLVLLLCAGVIPHPADGSPGSGSASKVFGTVLGLGTVALMIATWYLWRALRGGRGEYFEVRERGLVHGTAHRVEVWQWSDIAGVRGIDQRDTALRRYLGAQYLCRVLLRDGRRFSFTGLTSGYSALGAALAENCPFLPDSTGPKWLWSTVSLVCAAMFGFCLVFLLSHPETETQVLHDGYTQTVYTPGLSDGTFGLLILGLLVSFVFGTSAVILLIRARILAQRATDVQDPGRRAR